MALTVMALTVMVKEYFLFPVFHPICRLLLVPFRRFLHAKIGLAGLLLQRTVLLRHLMHAKIAANILLVR